MTAYRFPVGLWSRRNALLRRKYSGNPGWSEADERALTEVREALDRDWAESPTGRAFYEGLARTEAELDRMERALAILEGARAPA